MRSLYVMLAFGLGLALGCTNKSPSPDNNPRAAARTLALVPVGSTITMQATKDISQTQTGSPGSQKNIFLMVLADTKPWPYESTAVLQMFKARGDAEPVYSFTGSELKAMTDSTHCSAQVAKYQDGARAGEALFCGGALDLSKVHHFVLKQSETDQDFATSYTIDFVDKANDVVAITMSFN